MAIWVKLDQSGNCKVELGSAIKKKKAKLYRQSCETIKKYKQVS